MTTTLRLHDLPDHEGTTFDPSSWLSIGQARIDQFGEATDDLQWIHVDPAAAADGPFGTTIAHGYLTLALIPRLMADVVAVDCGQTLNYGAEKLRFPAPVPVDSRLRLQLTLAQVQSVLGGHQALFSAVVEREGGDKPVCVASIVYRFLA